MVPESPVGEQSFGAAIAARVPFAKAVQKRIEVIVLNDEDAVFRMLGIVFLQLFDHLHPDGGFSCSLFAEHNRSGRVGGIGKYFIPDRVVGAVQTEFLENVIALGVFLTEGVFLDPVVI